jgi:hypothetical protein
MQYTHCPRKHPRGSSPHQEMKQRLDDWVRGLLPIEQPAEDSSTSPYESIPLQPVGQRVDHGENWFLRNLVLIGSGTRQDARYEPGIIHEEIRRP